MMPKVCSHDLRVRAATSVAADRTCRETAALFAVGMASVVRGSKRWWNMGSADAKPRDSRRRGSSLAAKRA